MRGGSRFQPRPAIRALDADHTEPVVPPNTPVESVPRPLPMVNPPVEEVILQLDGHVNVGYQPEEGQETEVVQNGPDEQGAGLDPEPVSNESFLSYRNFCLLQIIWGEFLETN